MPSKCKQLVLWGMVILFATLQTISPFIHAHLEADTSAQGYGLHIHEAYLNQAPDTVHTLRSLSAPTVTIGVDEAVIRGLGLAIPVFFAALMLLLLFLAQLQFQHHFFSFFSKPPAVVRPQIQSRAPPFSF